MKFFNQKGIWSLKDSSKYLHLQQYEGKFLILKAQKTIVNEMRNIYTVHLTCSHRCAFLMLKYPCEFSVSHNVMGDNKF